MDTTRIAGLIPFAAACLCAAMSGAFFRPGAWYEQLAKPAWGPPNWLFAPAWTFFYICIAIAGWLVWRSIDLPLARLALAAWVLQIVLNACWPGIFFGLHKMGWAFAELVVLWVSIAATVSLFAQVSGTATLLLLPYLAWVTFASALNLSLWQLNRLTA